MPDYNEIYLKIFRASEQAVNILVAAQQEGKEHYISLPEFELAVVALPKANSATFAFIYSLGY